MRFKVATTDEVPDGKSKLVQVGDKMIAIFQWQGIFFAIDELCPHRAGPLSEGVFDGATVTCPWHGSKFEVATGKCLGTGPAARDIQPYAVFREGDALSIEILTAQEAVGES
jgi:nitrite reductase/ring-hydroxylating ferredoxin subunit